MLSDKSGSESFKNKRLINFTDSDNIFSNNISYNDINDIEEEFSKFLEDVELNTDKYEIKLKETYCNILNINLDNQNFGNKII
jgi:hypothetical protein